MSEKKTIVTQEDYELAVKTIAQFYDEREIGFALIDASSVLVAWQGKPLTIESMLNHAHKIVEFENGTRIMDTRMAAKAASEVREKEKPEEKIN